MYILYFSPGSCSLIINSLLEELGVPFELKRVDLDAVIARWGRWLDPPANEMANIRPFYTRMVERPAVARAMQREGIKAFGTP